MEKVIFDTNAYLDLVADKKFDKIEKNILQLKAKEKKNNIESLISPIVLRELLAHLADKKDARFEMCLKANKALYHHCSINESYKMIATSEILISNFIFKKDIPCKIKTDNALGQICSYLASNPKPFVFKKLQNNLNLNKNFVQKKENEFASYLKQFIRSWDTTSKGWRIFENDEKSRKDCLTYIRSDNTSIDIALAFVLSVYEQLLKSGLVSIITEQELYNKAIFLFKEFPEPITLYKYVLENLVNSEFNLMENNRSNFVWDIHLMFNIGNHYINGCKLHFVTSDKAIIKTSITENAKYTIHSFDEYMNYLK